MQMQKRISAADLFCGGGGWTTGLQQACRALGIVIRAHTCVNHWKPAIMTHRSNHGYAHHVCDSLNTIDPFDIGLLDAVIASPECTHFSIARGGAPVNDQKRSPAGTVPAWIEACRPAFFAIENVREFANWGEMGADGKPSKDGALFLQNVVQPLRDLGYSVEWRVLCCADYGDPTTRRRLFILGRRDGAAVQWPEPTHGASRPLPWIPAREIIDWSIESQSIFSRPKPLCEATLRRIEHGIRKYWGEWAEPFLVILRGQSNSAAISSPLPTLTTGQHIGLVEPFMVEQSFRGAGDKLVRGVSQPVNTLLTKDHTYLCEPFLTKLYGTGLSESTNKPLPTVTSGGNKFGLVEGFITQNEHSGRVHLLNSPMPTITANGRAFDLCTPFIVEYYGSGSGLEPQSIDKPLPTVTCRDRFGVVQQFGLDIRYRMLQPHELAAAMGFPKDYLWYGSKTEVVRQIGNAVPVNTARAILSTMIRQTILQEAVA